jgi:hypothetical protein
LRALFLLGLALCFFAVARAEEAAELSERDPCLTLADFFDRFGRGFLTLVDVPDDFVFGSPAA